MSFPITYAGDPAVSDLEQVRHLIGDTRSDDPFLTDNEIRFHLDGQPTAELAAASACEAIAAQFAREPDQGAGKLRASFSKVYQQFKDLAKTLRIQHSAKSAKTFVGGSSKSDKDTRNSDDDRVKPFFHKNLFTIPGSRLDSTEDFDRRHG